MAAVPSSPKPSTPSQAQPTPPAALPVASDPPQAQTPDGVRGVIENIPAPGSTPITETPAPGADKEHTDNESAISDDEFKSIITDAAKVPGADGSSIDRKPEDVNKESDNQFTCFELGESLICQLKEQSTKVLELNNLIKVKKGVCPRSICEEYSIEDMHNKLIFELEHLLEMIIEACECKDHLCNIVKNIAPKTADNRNKRISASSMCQELNHSLKLQEKLFTENVEIEDDRYKLQEELVSREQIIDCLQQKFNLLQSELLKLKRSQMCGDKQSPAVPTKANEIEQRLDNYRKKTDSLEKNFECMAHTLKKLNYELECVQKDRQALDNYEQEIKHKKLPCPCPDHSPRKLQSPCHHSDSDSQSSFSSPCHPKPQFTSSCQPKPQDCSALFNLQNKAPEDCNTMFNEYRKKEAENALLKEKLDKFCRSASHDSSTEKSELDMVKKKCCELIEEQNQFKVLIIEQADQLEEYRNKFLCAQTRVEEHRCKIEALESNNSSIEDRINEEIGRIKLKFQEKLKELCPLPKLVEEQKRSLCYCNQEKNELEKKYKCVCDELCKLKEEFCKMEEQLQKLLCKERQMKKIMEEYDQMKFCIEKLAGDKRYLEAKIKQTQDELDNFRVESAKIVARNKECANANKEALQCQINRLEIELAQCRANSSMMITEREECIKTMQTKLKLLGTNFDDAQTQVKALKHQIEQLKNGGDEYM